MKPDPIKVRIVRWSGYSTRYCIQYKRKRSWWPFWTTIWEYMWEPWCPMYNWNPILEEYEIAKKTATSFTDYSDILNYQKVQKDKEQVALKYRAAERKITAPVSQETILP